MDRTEGDAGAELTLGSVLMLGGDNGVTLGAPLIEGRWEPNVDIFGGRLRLEGSAVLLERSVGTDTRRASASADWRTSLILEKRPQRPA